jgi:hypothetical protein
MSHFTSIQTQIKDIEALRGACGELGLSLLANARARGFGGNLEHGDYVIQLKGPYDIAANRQPEGTYGLSTDWWEGHVEREVGPNFGRLLQLYTVHKATREARKRGLTVQRTQRSDGSIKLCLS